MRRLGEAVVFLTDRTGGVSADRYATLNLADHVGDSPDAVSENRRRVASAVGAQLGTTAAYGDRPEGVPVVWLSQVHGSTVHVVTPAAIGSTGVAPIADAAVTSERGVGVAVLTADCVPVAIACEGAVGVAHAGWQGLVDGVLGEAVATLTRVGTGRVRALIGPCIHPERYEFGADDLLSVVRSLGLGVAARTSGGAPALDLRAAAREALVRAGVHDADVEDVGVCTSASPRHFSHRRDGVTGRQAMIAILP